MKDGSVRQGRVVGLDATSFRVALPGPTAGQAVGTTSIPRQSVLKITFGPDAALAAVEKNASVAATASARVLWQRLETFLSIPESHAAKAGMALGKVLLLSPDKAQYEEALALYRRIEKEAWSEEDRELAKRGRLAAMLQTGRIDEVAGEVENLSSQSGDPALLLQTKLLLAKMRLAALRKLLEENPRWNEDPPVAAERGKFLNEGLDLALYPFLFNGNSAGEAAEGLWLAKDFYESADQPEQAAEVLGDIVFFYPNSPRAKEARALLDQPGTKAGAGKAEEKP